MLGQIDESDSRNQTELAKDVGITKGAVTQARDKLTGMLEAWCDKQRN
jgi:DNA-binding MarR family transcriptional regulator